ncbi:hypothetical protein Enr10x_21340 [Gimesia panareensis]|uniref:Phosphoadenosine phosphosulfate reductase n=1 Tax=Gimesia panareensis TaxID=2527978 RepID=A0A517Q5B5_9PLAN|nr:hypothetical protein [Gimesia panareensis]QDT26824.1 hypothetical protein Enr10x_21340 [Gimesia panareensis]
MKNGGTYAVGNFSICNEAGIPKFRDRYKISYPLREFGFDRSKCREVIAAAGLPIPPKSACFFCPAMRQTEIQRLAKVDPDLHRLAIEMESIYRGGKHFLGENHWTVKAVHKETGEKETWDCTAIDAVTARREFRYAFDDASRPYKYKVKAYPAVPGLGRDFAWAELMTG